MTARRTSSQSLKSISGAGIFALGLLLLFVNLDGVAAYMTNFAGVSAHEAQGILPALGLAGFHAFEAYAFDHDAFLSGPADLGIILAADRRTENLRLTP